MVTDSQFYNLPELSDEFTFINDVRTPNPEQSAYVGNGLEIENSSLSIHMHNYVIPRSHDFGTLVQSLNDSTEIECLGGNESDSVFKSLNHILMEENMDENPSVFHDPLALQATEKSFYDVIDKKYPPSPCISGESVDPSCSGDAGYNDFSVVQFPPPNQSSQSSFTSSQPLLHSVNSARSNNGGKIDSFMNMHLAPNLFSYVDSMVHFRKGMEEARKFLPTNSQLVFDLGKYTLAPRAGNEPPKVVVMVEKDQSPSSRGRKHLYSQDSNLDARRRKQSAVYEDEGELSEFFDKMLLHDVEGVTVSYNGDLKYLNGVDKYFQQNGLPLVRRNRKPPSKKQGVEMDTVYLQSLLVSCAQAVDSDDVETAHERLKQIRQYAPSAGDGCQRTANVFANALEARLTGTGTQMYAELAAKRISAAEKLKANHVYLSACPFIEISRVFANRMILKIVGKASTLHIVDFGISYGFHWPVLIQFLSIREGGSPNLRVTGIDFPQDGFRPAILLEETGQRLAKYCKRFNVPFEYQAIASHSWETIDINDLKLARDEALAVNCMLGFQNLPEETLAADSPKDGVLKLIRTMKPDVFVHSIVNVSYNSSLFLTRFREAFFYYSSLFDMFDVTLPRDDPQRLHFEKEVYGREVVNIIACEGRQRVVRPETYKQWDIRSRRAGFKTLPLDKNFYYKSKLEACYCKDFLFSEDGDWMLQGWKGRVLYGSSCWVPV